MSARRLILIAAFAGLAAHAAVIQVYGNQVPGPLITDSIELLLGITVTVTAIFAARRSGSYARRVWALASLAFGLYAAGQGIVTYYRHFLHAPMLSPWFSSQFLFFWVVPLIMSVLLRKDDDARGFDWALVLDFCQVFMVALTLHLSVFAMSANWQLHGRELQFLEWKIRMFRDAVVLSALFAKITFSHRRTRSLFLRFGAFFLTYSIVSGFYLYAQAAFGYSFGWLDLLWSIPRLIMIWGAVTWTDHPYTAEELLQRRHETQGRFPLHLASMLGPLMVTMIALPISPSAPVMAGALILASFSLSGFRFLLTRELQVGVSQELQTSRSLLESLVESTTEAIYIRDLQGRYILANPAARRLLGSEEIDPIGRPIEDFFTPAGARDTRANDMEVIRTNQALEVEKELEINGKHFIIMSKKSPFRDASGTTVGVLGIGIDVTERRKMEAELRRAQRMESVGTLAAGVAHDFNNLITVIKGYTQLVMEDLASPSAPSQLKEIDAAASRAEGLTRQLLAFSRQQVMQPRVTNLNEIVKGIEKMLRRLIGADIQIVVLLASGLDSVRVDPGQIEQAIMNLVANARDAMPQGGKLTISTTNSFWQAEVSKDGFFAPPGRYVILSVSDTGSGMDEATQSRMFEPFFTTKPVGKGTGLGLSTVYGITKQSAGYIKVESRPGKGSTFQVFFPVVGESAQKLPSLDHAQQIGRGNETILVVEDEPKLADVIATSLTRRGYNVLLAHEGGDAIEFATSHPGPIHLMLLDVVMPKPSGKEVAQKVSSLRPGIQVLWMSGYTDDTVVRHGILEPGINFLPKPFTPGTLAQKIRELCDSKPA